MPPGGATEAGRRIGVTYDFLEMHDRALMPTRENRNMAIQRKPAPFQPDIVVDIGSVSDKKVDG